MFLCYDQPPQAGSKPTDGIRAGFIGVVTPDPKRSSRDKVWMHLHPEQGKGMDALASYAEQYLKVAKQTFDTLEATIGLGVNLTDALEKAILRALEKDPAARFQDMASFAEALRAVPREPRAKVAPEPEPACGGGGKGRSGAGGA